MTCSNFQKNGPFEPKWKVGLEAGISIYCTADASIVICGFTQM